MCFPTVLPIPTVASPQEECLFGIIAYEYYVRQEAASLFKGAAAFEKLQASNCELTLLASGKVQILSRKRIRNLSSPLSLWHSLFLAFMYIQL